MSYRGGLFEAIKSLQPSAEFGIMDDDYSTLEWYDDPNVIPIPSREEVQQEHNRLKLEWETNHYQRQRQGEYPPLADLADAMYWAAKGDNTKLDNYYAACEAVKLKYPKS